MIRYSADKISKCLLWETQWWTEKCWNTSVSECEAYRETIAWWKQRSSYLLRCLWQPCDYGFLHSKILKFNSQRLSSSLSIQFKSKVALKIKADDTETTKAIRELKRVWNAFESECITNEIAPPPSPLLFFGSFPSLYSLFSLFFFFFNFIPLSSSDVATRWCQAIFAIANCSATESRAVRQKVDLVLTYHSPPPPPPPPPPLTARWMRRN